MLRGEGKKTKLLREAILNVLEQFQIKMSSRQVFYQCVSSGAVENNKLECGRVLRLLVAMRRDGSVPYDRIVDRTRVKHHSQGWDHIGECLEQSVVHYRRDLWLDQPVVPMVACEKQALEGIFAEAVDEYGAALWTIRGFNSESFAYEWAEHIRLLNQQLKEVVVFYFGDHDPSGLAIEADAITKLKRHGAVFHWRRVGLLHEDFERFNLVNVPVKRSDTRAKSYLSKFGDRAAELDALPPDELHERIEDALLKYIDVDRWHQAKAEERAERESLAMVVNAWPIAVAAAKGAA